MRKPATNVAAACALFALVSACTSGTGTTPASPTAIATTIKEPDVSQDESGPESPISYGLQVPTGATQLGPLIRYRSARLVAAYEPELTAALAQKEAEASAKAAEKEAEAGTDATPTPSPTPSIDTPPSDDTFKLLDESPRPDTTISLMRIDGNPTDVVRRMLAEVNALLPDSDLVLDDLSQYCSAKERRIIACRLAVRGLTAADRDVRITVTVDPGNLTTRTSGPSNLTRPVMTLMIEYVGEPRKGQLNREKNSLDKIPSTSSRDKSDLIWPKMDEDAPATTPLVNGWIAPANSDIILSGSRTPFVMITTPSATESDLIAQQFAVRNTDKGAFTKDVVEDLNEVSTTYTATTDDGSIARATFVLSARGNYTALFYSPPTK